MNLPNILTLSRLGLVFLMMVLLASTTIPFAKSMALVVFAIAGITDFLDGHIARRRNLVTAFGRLMDPLTDKVMVCAAFVSFVEIHFRVQKVGMNVPLVPAWIAVIIISREFLVTGLRLLAANKGNIISAGRWGKHKTAWQIVAIVIILLGLAIRSDLLRDAGAQTKLDFDFAFYWITYGVSVSVALITVASGAMYFMQHRELISGRH
jgi:CDP-diacylglycerol--glycerol-3-phosphate 3-phosphatidyltransferase